MYYLVCNENNSMAAHSPEMIVKVFKKCHISNAMDETDDEMLWNESEEDEEDKGNDCEDGDSDIDW